MVKKITKYLKFVVCCALILSLIAPSYAALSASDGSAFVTKAEFDSVLADFNSRLTTFEAGINSKIDSQVTSYLDRNGIWNGKAFESKFNEAFVANQVDFGFTDVPAGTTVWTKHWNGDEAGTCFYTKIAFPTDKVYFFSPGYDYKTEDFVIDVPKSGMLVGFMIERADMSFSNINLDFMSADGLWSNIVYNLGTGNRNFDNIFNTNMTARDKSIAVYNGFTSKRGMQGYYGQTAHWVWRIENSAGEVKQYSDSYALNAATINGDGNNTQLSWAWAGWSDVLPKMHLLQFFVEKGERLIFKYGWLGAGRGLDGDFCLFGQPTSAADNDKSNPVVWWYATKGMKIY